MEIKELEKKMKKLDNVRVWIAIMVILASLELLVLMGLMIVSDDVLYKFIATAILVSIGLILLLSKVKDNMRQKLNQALRSSIEDKFQEFTKLAAEELKKMRESEEKQNHLQPGEQVAPGIKFVRKENTE